MDADLAYSATLLGSLVAGGLALAAGLSVASGRAAVSRRAAAAAPAAAWALLLVSVGVHLRWGHAPSTPGALPPLAFLREHPSFALAALLPAVALALLARAGARRGRRTG